MGRARTTARPSRAGWPPIAPDLADPTAVVDDVDAVDQLDRGRELVQAAAVDAVGHDAAGHAGFLAPSAGAGFPARSVRKLTVSCLSLSSLSLSVSLVSSCHPPFDLTPD